MHPASWVEVFYPLKECVCVYEMNTILEFSQVDLGLYTSYSKSPRSLTCRIYGRGGLRFHNLEI